MKRDTCTNGGTCAECFGAGSIDCSSDTCYNPTAGESCCADGGKFNHLRK
jgi:hypothetical protein